MGYTFNPFTGNFDAKSSKASDITDFDTEVSNNTDVAANTTHRTSNGTDHTYIDQDVTTTASPTFAGATMTDRLNFPAENFTISNPPIRFTAPDTSDDESSKGNILEWGGVMTGGDVLPYGIATQAYKDNPSATFTAPGTVGVDYYRKWGWILTHYDSPLSTGEDVHQHLNLETVKADWTTVITRLQISFGEDIALVSFPNSNVKVYDTRYLQIGTDAAGAYISHNTTDARINVTGNTPWNFSGTGGIRIGSAGSPSARLHVERSDDANTLLIRNTGASNTAANILSQTQTSGSRIFQGGVQGDAVNRISVEASGKIEWGDGSATRDTNLYRSAANVLYTDDGFSVGSKLSVVNTGSTGALETDWSSDVVRMFSTQSRSLYIGDSGGYLDFAPAASSGNPKFSYRRITSTSGSLFRVTAYNGTEGTGGFTGSSGTQYGLKIDPNIAQSGTAAYAMLWLNPTVDSTGSGSKHLILAQVDGTTKFSVDDSGNTTLVDAANIAVGTTTGTKIGTATTQKIGLWNTTPIVQPTTGVAAATFAANTSGIADDTATFDGYTIGQVVKALRNIGILA